MQSNLLVCMFYLFHYVLESMVIFSYVSVICPKAVFAWLSSWYFLCCLAVWLPGMDFLFNPSWLLLQSHEMMHMSLCLMQYLSTTHDMTKCLLILMCFPMCEYEPKPMYLLQHVCSLPLVPTPLLVPEKCMSLYLYTQHFSPLLIKKKQPFL